MDHYFKNVKTKRATGLDREETGKGKTKDSPEIPDRGTKQTSPASLNG